MMKVEVEYKVEEISSMCYGETLQSKIGGYSSIMVVVFGFDYRERNNSKMLQFVVVAWVWVHVEGSEMAVKLPTSVAYFRNIRFKKSFTHHNDPNTKLIRIHKKTIQNQIKLPQHRPI